MSALLSTFGIDWHLLFANAVNFIVLAALLTWLLYRPVMKMVAERQSIVAKGVEDAENASKKLAYAEQDAASRMRKAEQDATTVVESARQAATDTKTQILKDAEARAAEVARDAEARAKEASAKALRESETEIARLAVLAAEKVMREGK